VLMPTGPSLRPALRYLSIVFAIVLLAVAVCACGDTAKTASSAHDVSSTGASPSGPPVKYVSPLVRSESLTGARAHYLNDGDNDPIGDEDPDNRRDDDNDASWDYQPETNENNEFRDGDDSSIVTFGAKASAPEAQAIAAIVKRYYVAASVSDGGKACATILPGFAAAIPLDYGRDGSAYLRGAKTCQAVMTRLFKHLHHELSVPPTVVAVRVSGERALALLGSRKMPASYIDLQRERGAWMIDELTGSRMP
jgi:hypothetical protein